MNPDEKNLILALLICTFVSGTTGIKAQIDTCAFTMEENLLDSIESISLGLTYPKGLETSTIFRPGPKDYKYNHGVVLFPFKGQLYAQWQSSAIDEDAPETRVMYTHSHNGLKWSKPKILSGPINKNLTTNGGW